MYKIKSIINCVLMAVLVISCEMEKEQNMQTTIFGEDDRVLVSEIPSSHEDYKPFIHSVAVIVKKDETSIDYQQNILNFDKAETAIDRYNFCPGEKFVDETSIGSCTGFYVGKNIMITAGHCISKEDGTGISSTSAHQKYAIFDYLESANSTPLSKVYKLKVLDFSFTGHAEDWAILEIDPVLSTSEDLLTRIPFKFRTEGEVSRSSTLSTMGHPTGLPMQLSKSATIISTFGSDIRANIDSVGGGSGSPVINDKTMEVEGIFTRVYGSTTEMTADDCRRYTSCVEGPNRSCNGASVMRMSTFLEPLLDYLQ